MKKFLYAAMAATVLFASCAKEDNGNGGSKDEAQLTIKLSGVVQSAPGTRAVEGQGSTAVGTIQLQNGHIFVIDALGVVIENEALNVGQATTGGGQIMTNPVPSDSRVYIIGNIPAGDAATIPTLGTFGAIQTAVSAISSQTNYRQAALANSDGAPAAITVNAGGTTADVNVSIKPLISRMELVQVKGKANIKSFDVTGVYVDSYHPNFTYVGGFNGTMHSQGSSKTFTQILADGMGDTGTWTATDAATSGIFIADPQTGANGDVWAYQVASGALPRFIIELDNISYEDASSAVVTLTGKHYLTVQSYTGLGSLTFERGKIYRIGATNGIEFDEDDLGTTPNPTDLQLTVEVSIDEWDLVTPGANLQ